MFKKGPGKKNLVGLDIGSSSVKAVELSKKGAALQLLNLGFENLQTDTIVDGQIMELNNVSNVISQIFNQHQIRTTRVAAGVSGHSVIVKNIVLPQMSQEELQESFSWHAEEHIPFDIADVNLDYELTSRSDDALHVLMAACKSDKIANVKQAIQLAGRHAGFDVRGNVVEHFGSESSGDAHFFDVGVVFDGDGHWVEWANRLGFALNGTRRLW